MVVFIVLGHLMFAALVKLNMYEDISIHSQTVTVTIVVRKMLSKTSPPSTTLTHVQRNVKRSAITLLCLTSRYARRV